ncbi:hypothetical protein CN378_00165 [Bacillus sp. AFS015802]|uniref:hypothetical protein n=1 Tax=Bacillus sp. AFS015802 TaxID=2033486 RepID=UPI000BF4980F|nr:hypothetical protein [Bacillus sp. AFS015802]PFA70721.1 hypothetical protein CN378_00165 [Bacillus sp. AFS015802]
MSLPFFITILIILIYIVLFMKKELSFTSNSIQFMVLSIISTNYITIMTNKLEWMKASEDVTQFISLLINRECILPLVGVIMVNGYLNYEKRKDKVICFLSLLFFISVLDILHVHFHSLSYPEWSLLNTVMVNGIYLAFCIWMGKGLYYLQSKGERRHGQNI